MTMFPDEDDLFDLDCLTYGITRDKNGLFIIKQCITYICRLMKYFRSLDSETIEFIQWLIPEEKEYITKFFIDILNRNEYVHLKSDLSEYTEDPSLHPRVIFRIMRDLLKKEIHLLTGQFLELLENKHKTLQYRGSSDHEKGMASLKKMFNLTDGEVKLSWLFFVCAKWQEAKGYFMNRKGIVDFSHRSLLLATLDMKPREFDAALNGTLNKAGILENNLKSIVFNDDFFLDLDSSSTEKLTKEFYIGIPNKTIPLEYHQIAKKETEHILRLLKEKPGGSTQILLYGSPGTGKTTYAYGLAHQLNIPAYQIVQKEHKKKMNRRTSLIGALNMTNQGDGSLIIVDEADNILNTHHSEFVQEENHDKSWLNHILEEPGARMIWITNTIDNVEESVLRRFAYSLHFHVLNRQQRVQLWQGILKSSKALRFFNTPDLEKLAHRYQVSAGVIDLAVKKAREMKLDSKEQFQEAVTLALDAHVRLVAGGEAKNHSEAIEKSYSTEGLNIQGNLEVLMQDLESFDMFLRRPGQTTNRNMNLLFYGPPGTGKSELARYIGSRFQREIICRRASDIMDSYIGVTEKNIRNTFADAEREQAVLVFDEADTFLFSREMAQRSWEVSFVNEFLTRMERYQGILVCTTNRMTGLDSASIRRFRYKIGFDCLKPEGNVVFFQRLLAPLTGSDINQYIKKELYAIGGLAPGDFRIVRDRYAMMPPDQITSEALVNALREESAMKKMHHGEKSIGFMC